MKNTGVWITLLLVFTTASIIIGLATAAVSTGQQLVMERCTVCHGTERICNNLEVKNPETWRSTVVAMKSNGAKVSKTEIEEIVRYLASLPKGSAPVCP